MPRGDDGEAVGDERGERFAVERRDAGGSLAQDGHHLAAPLAEAALERGLAGPGLAVERATRRAP